MAKKKVYDKDIDKNVKWDGDSTTENLPVSGNSIEKFLKKQLNSKVGFFYYDTTNNRYLVFADESTRDEYIADTTKTELILGSFDAPFNYSAEITLTSPSYVALLNGTKGNYLAFTFDTKNKNKASVGENVTCTYTFIRNGVKKSVIQKYRYGQAVQFYIDDYLGVGTNNITIGIVGQNTLAATTIGVIYQVVDLTLSSTYNISQVYNPMDNPAITAAIPFFISGYGTKEIEWYLDGVQLPYVQVEDEILGAETTRTKYIQLKDLNQGKHSLQFRAYTIINGEKFYSNTIYHDILIYTATNDSPIIGVSTVIPVGKDIIAAGKGLQLYGIQQYVPCDIQFAVYNPRKSEITTGITIDEKKEGSIIAQNGNVNVYSIRSTKWGLKTMVITAGEAEYTIGLNIEKSTTSLEPIEDGLIMDLIATGKSNNDSDKDSWKSGDYSTTFTGFNWNVISGWNNGRLLISNSAKIDINISPLANDPANLGRTLEFEFSTKNVEKDDAVICDLRNEQKTGILITASEVSLRSAGGVVVSTKFKSEENIRITFVINQRSGVTNKGLTFIYVNGILSGAASFASVDNFTSTKTLSIGGTQDVDIALKHLRFYNTALNSDQILNNYILYRDSASELLKLYDKNNVYEPNTQTLSLDALAAQCPILKITGDIPSLENTTDKNKTIYVDLEYVNLQNPELQFTTQGTKMKPQGTSSMGYPKKNYRIYTNYGSMWDNNGKLIEGGKYSFTAKAQPVTCWCFKADYAESSGTHNTGIARLWNNVMSNAQIDGEYILRTEAQKKAIESKYPYDVRTTVDGFPCHLVYRLNEESDWIYIGKYNFNNDKSTESVFGFKDIPGFDNSKMQCLEVLNNGNHLALFHDVDNFDEDWANAYDFRYPDGGKDVTYIKDFSEWLVSTRYADDTVFGDKIEIKAEIKTDENGPYTDNAENRQKKFQKEKWDYMDVYKVAAYYIYLMVFAAVDQPVKNAMFTTEGTHGIGTHCKWFFINYDNDTINGLRNDGPLIFGYKIDRQSIDPSFEEKTYAYAGHDSTLWNNLEADSEFMSVVSKVYDALYIAGLSYEKVIDMFDNQQMAKWCERVYNKDTQYKYIGPYTDSNINNLYMVQGSRQAHRRWWLSHRFDLMDSKFAGGAYKSKSIEFKAAAAPIGLQFGITAGNDLFYGYGVNNVIAESGISLKAGESHVFTTKMVLNVGDPVRIYSAVNIEAIDLSNFIEYLSTLTITKVNDETVGTKLKKLILGVDTSSNSKRNKSLSVISGLSKATSLQILDVSGFQGITTLDLTSLSVLRTLKAYESGLTSLIIASGTLITTMELPETMQSLLLDSLPDLSSGFSIKESGKNLSTINIRNCPNLDTKTLLFNWFDNKVADNASVSITLEGINWTDVDPQKLIDLGAIKTAGGILSLKGTITTNSINMDNINSLRTIFGDNCFTPGNELYISAPSGSGLFIVGPGSINEGDKAQYSVAVFTEEKEGIFTWWIATDGEVKTLDKETIDDTGLLASGENSYNSDRTITVRCKFKPKVGLKQFYADYKVQIKGLIYPTFDALINGGAQITEVNKEYGYSLIPQTGVNGKYNLEWNLSGDALTQNLVKLASSDNDGCHIKCLNILAEPTDLTITVKVKRAVDGVLKSTITKDVSITIPGIIMTKTSNPEVMDICYKKGWCANANYMTEKEAAAVTDIGTAFKSSRIKHFDEFKYFINIAKNLTDVFENAIQLTTITLPDGINCLGSDCFYNCYRLTTINNFPTIPTEFGVLCLDQCDSLILPSDIYIKSLDWSDIFVSVHFKDNILRIHGEMTELNYFYSFKNKGLKQVVLPDTIESLCSNIFANNELGDDFKFPANLTKIGNNAFGGNQFKNLVIPDSVTYIGDSAFNCSTLEAVHIGKGLNIDVNMFGANGTPKEITVDSQNPNLYVKNDGLYKVNGTSPMLLYAYKDKTGEFIAEDSCMLAQASYQFSNSLWDKITLKGINSIVTGINTFANAALKELQITCKTSGSNNFYDLSSCLNLKKISIDTTSSDKSAAVASNSQFGNSVNNYTGRNTYNTGENILYVPQGATGYDKDEWINTLLNPDKCGFKISYTL